MIQLQFPPPRFKRKQAVGKEFIFDPIRKKFVVLTPEEWVRQNMIQYLVQVMGYPAGLIRVEKEIQLGTLRKRCDLLVYNRAGNPWMIVECKEMETSIDAKTLDQILRYNMALPARYLLLTNGVVTFCVERNDSPQGWQLLQQLPSF